MQLISAICITYGRPRLLEEAIESFIRQDYENKELVILNDLTEQTLVYEHPQVKIFNYKNRFKTLGEKRNECIELSKGNILVIWDDDDIQLPWRLSQIAKEFKDNPGLEYFRPEKGWFIKDKNTLDLPSSGVGFVTMPSWTRAVFLAVGKYNKLNFGEDQDIDSRIRNFLDQRNVKIKSYPDEECPFIYGWRTDAFHLSGYGADKEKEPTGLEKSDKSIRSKPIEEYVNLKPFWRCDYIKLTRDLLKKEEPMKQVIEKTKETPNLRFKKMQDILSSNKGVKNERSFISSDNESY